ncbi:MAG: thioredoxin [Verrucomicrobiaceae bacterium]|nr:thioredoxin [Verrucomicrobiaceae bacterium]
MSDNLVTLTEANFQDEIENSMVPFVVDFWAEWCGPCKMLTPTLEALAGELSGKAKIGKVNVDENPNLAAQFGVRSIPMLVFFKDGQQKDVVVGLQSKDALLRKIEAL